MKIILFRLGGVLLVIWVAVAVIYAQSDNISGTVDDADDCVTPFAGEWFPADNVQFEVTQTGNYTFTYDSDTIANDVYFYMLDDSFDDTQVITTQAGFIDNGSEFNSPPLFPLSFTTTATIDTTYFMTTNNNQRFGDEASCETRVSTNSGDYVIRVTGDGLVCIGSCPDDFTGIIVEEEEDSKPQQVFWDERINDYDSGNPVVLYGKHDGDDNWRLEVYNANQTGMLFHVPAAQIAAVPECPTTNTLIAQDATTGIALYRLPQRTVTDEGAVVCPFQLNAPTGEPGKVYVIVFDTLYPSTYYESWEEFIGN